MSKKTKHLDFELNLIPCIDLLSVCICFLLLTAVWLNVGAMNVKQAVGGQSADQTEKKPTLWVSMESDGAVQLEAKDSHLPLRLTKMRVEGREGKPNIEGLSVLLSEIRKTEPLLTTALIQPQAASVYEDIIELMDQFKESGLIDLGVSPL